MIKIHVGMIITRFCRCYGKKRWNVCAVVSCWV